MTNQIPNRWTKGKSTKKFQFTYQDYADLLGMTEAAVRKAASRGPSEGGFKADSLRSFIEFYMRKMGGKPEATKHTPARSPQSPQSLPVIMTSNISNANPLSPETERAIQKTRDKMARDREAAEFHRR